MSVHIPDPTAVLLLTQLSVGEDGRIQPTNRDLRRRQRHHQRRARLRKLLA